MEPDETTPRDFIRVRSPGIGTQVRAAEHDLPARNVHAPEWAETTAHGHDGVPTEVSAPLTAPDAVPVSEPPPCRPLLPDGLARDREAQSHPSRPAGRGDSRPSHVHTRDAHRLL